MYALTPEEFDIAHKYFEVAHGKHVLFIEYFNKLWIPKKESWCRAWRSDVSTLKIKV